MRAVTAGLVAMIGIALSLAGCATAGKFESKLRSWEGQDAKAVINAWGQPESTEKLHNGHTVMVYSYLSHPPVAYGESRRDLASSDGSSSSKPTVHIMCATFFEVDSATNKVVNVIFRGDDCKA